MTWTAVSLRPQYSRFLDSSTNMLFANHSHQAWPNVARFGQLQAFDVAANLHGSKWAEVEKQRQFLRSWISKRIGNDSFGGLDGVSWGQNTYDFLCAFISSFSFEKGDYIITSNSEFHSARRLFQRLEEDGLEVVRIGTWSMNETEIGQTGLNFFDRMNEVLIDKKGLKPKFIFFSSVSYLTGSLLPNFYEGLGSLLLRQIPVLVDLYHHIGPLNFQVPQLGQEYLYLVGGGYKYLQMGEANCWFRAPIDCKLRPRNTGWFAEFSSLESQSTDKVNYPKGAERFRGATYEPSSIFRAHEVAKFFDGIGMDSKSLSKKYQKDVSKIYDRISKILHRLPEEKKNRKKLFLLSHKDKELRAGFVSLHFTESLELHAFLLKNFVETDYRGDVIRFGPAPYTLDREIDHLLELVSEYFDKF